MSNAQPMAQLSPASVAAASAVAATRSAFSTSQVAVRPRGAHEQPGAVPGRDPGRRQRPVQRGQGLRGLAGQHAAQRQRPVQVDEEIGLEGVLERAVRYLLGRKPVPDAVEGVGESAGQPAMPGRISRGTGCGAGQELGRHRGRLADQQISGAGQPVQHPRIHRLGRAAQCGRSPEHLPGHPVGRRARLRQGTPSIAVPGGAHRRRHLVVQRFPDQRVPEPEAPAGLGQHADGTCFVHCRDQVGHAAIQHDRQIRDREIRAEQRRRPQDIAHRAGHEVQAVRDGGGQGARCRTAPQFGGSRLGDGQAGAPGQRRNKLGDVERIARRPVGEPQQAAVGPPARQGGHQVGHRRLAEPGELEPDRVARHPPQRQQVVPLVRRAHHPHQQQRHLPGRPRQPSPQRDAGLIGPLQVVHDQNGRPHRVLLGDQGQQLLRQHGRHVRAAIRADLTAQQPDDRFPPGIGGRLAHPQPVEERQQRQGLAELVAGPPEHLTAEHRRFHHRRPQQRGLADARLTLDEHRTTVPPRSLFHQPGQ